MVHRYYHRLNPWQQRVYRQSDQITSVPLPAPVELADFTLAVGQALSRGEPRAITAACNQLLRQICARLAVTPPRVTVLEDRPAGHWGELHGLYNPSQGPNGTITVWMRTARRSRVVAFRTFLRTLLHELCHHLDLALLGLRHSFHTTGFHKREASLYKQLLPSAGAASAATALSRESSSRVSSGRMVAAEAAPTAR